MFVLTNALDKKKSGIDKNTTQVDQLLNFVVIDIPILYTPLF